MEIKFRGKSLLSGKWVYGDYFSQYKDGQRNHYIVEHPYGLEGGRDTIWEIDPETVGQFTGLKDKNKFDIFKGDIVRGAWVSDVETLAEVLFRDGAFFTTDGELNYAWNVIGNVHDNPELKQE